MKTTLVSRKDAASINTKQAQKQGNSYSIPHASPKKMEKQIYPNMCKSIV